MSSELRWVLVSSILLGCLLLAGQTQGFFEAQERSLHDAMQSRRTVFRQQERDQELLVVEVTDACVEKFGPWPWPRSRIADLVESITRSSARVTALDVLFLDQDPEQDPRLAKVLRESGRVVLAGEIRRRTSWDNRLGGLSTRTEFASPTPVLAEVAQGLGFVNVDHFYDNQDGVVRRLPLATRVEGKVCSVLALEAVSLFNGVRPELGENGSLRLGGYQIPVSAPVATRGQSPLVEGRFLNIAFDASAYLEYARSGEHGLIPTVRARDVLAGNVPSKRFKDRLVLVGLNLRGLDRKVTPLGPMAGVQIQAHLARNLLLRRLLGRSSRLGAALLVVLAVALGAYLGLTLSAGWGYLSAFLLGVLWFGIGTLLFERGQFLVDLAAPLGGLVLSLFLAQVVVLSLGVRRHLKNLTLLHESGRRFSRTLDISLLTDDVCQRYRELVGDAPVALVFRPGESIQVETWFSQDFPEELRALLSRHRLQTELLDLMRVSDGLQSADRLRELSDCPNDVPLGEFDLIFPLGRFERARGFLFAVGVGDVLERGAEEEKFWSTHASMAATALENAGLYLLATVDALTTLFLRHFFDSSLEREFSRAGRYRGHLALLMTDIDHFKVFNDTHGHQVGDRVLRFVAEKVKESVRGVDIACRYGGEEFTIILPETDWDGAMLTAERIRSCVEDAYLMAGDKKLQVTISIGLACTDRSQAKSPEAFVTEADQALYQAKRAGRNRVVAWSPDAGQGS
jgi:diguanylate cyclase (GGDEF)-like protein